MCVCIYTLLYKLLFLINQDSYIFYSILIKNHIDCNKSRRHQNK